MAGAKLESLLRDDMDLARRRARRARHASLHCGVNAEQVEELCRLQLLDDLLHLGETPKGHVRLQGFWIRRSAMI